MSLCPDFVRRVSSEPLNLFVNQLGIVVHLYELQSHAIVLYVFYLQDQS